MLTIASALVTLLGSTAAAPAAEIVEPSPRTMSQAEIRAFNANLDKGHKYFIRCRRNAATGSFVHREFRCHTNEQWAKADVRGNDSARDVADRMASKAGSSN